MKICVYYHFCRIFPISLQIGRNKRQKNATSITLLKLKLHDEVSDLSAEQFLSNDMWDRLVSFGATDRDDAESQIQQSLQDSETEEQKRKREFMMKVYGKEIAYKEARSKSFKAWAQDLRQAEASTVNFYFFSVKNIHRFLAKFYEADGVDGECQKPMYHAGNVIFCDRCMVPFYSRK